MKGLRSLIQSLGSHPRRSRSQLIILTGFLLAITLLALVVIINGALFAENYETQQRPLSSERFIDNSATMENIVTKSLAAENHEQHETATAITDVEKNIEEATDILRGQMFEQHGEVISVTKKQTHGAWVITQQDTNEFTPADSLVPPGLVSWQVVEANGIRDGSMTVSSAEEIDRSNLNERLRLFRLTIIGPGTSRWDLWIYEAETSNEIALSTTINGKGNPVTECSSTPPVTIDFTSMTIDGNNCGFRFAEGISTPNYDLRYNNGDNATGTYRFIAGKENGASLGSSVGGQNVLDPTSGDTPQDDQPVAYDGVYSVAVSAIFDSESLSGNIFKHVIPKEPNTTQTSTQFSP